MTKHYLSICAIFKNEARYLREWIEFHRLVGVEHFYLYNNFSEDNYADVLRGYVAEGVVTLHRWNVHPGQVPAYNDCLRRHGDETRWMAFIDLDEFLFCPGKETVPERLTEFEGYGGVVVNWVTFGSSGHREPPAGLVIENYTRRGRLDVVIPEPAFLRAPGLDPTELDMRGPESYRPFNTQVKSIVDPSAAAECSNPHSFRYRKGKGAVDEHHRPARRNTEAVSVEKFRVNHYWSKSEAEFVEKVARGRSDMDVPRVVDEFAARDRYLNDEEDVEILRYAERVRGAVRRSMERDRERGDGPPLAEQEPPPLRRGLVGWLLGR
jgi:hypothetical protein